MFGARFYMVLGFLAFGFVVLVLWGLWWRGAKNGPWPFYSKKPLSDVELLLYHRLVKALPGFVLLAQVQLSRILGVKRGFNFHQWNNRINRMSVDFLVCLKDGRVVAVIELDDSSHERASRQEADAKKEKALSAAGILLVRWHVRSLPDEAAIRKAFVG